MDSSSKKMFVMLSVLAALFSCSSNGAESDKAITKEVDFAQASKMIEDEKPTLILDVRTLQEFDEGHIPGARLVPLNTLQDSLEILRPFKDQEIIAVCRSGRRSGIATEQLSDAGFEKTYNLKGGMIQWKQNGGKVE